MIKIKQVLWCRTSYFPVFLCNMFKNVLTAIPLEIIPTEFTWNGTAANKTVQKVVFLSPLNCFYLWYGGFKSDLGGRNNTNAWFVIEKYPGRWALYAVTVGEVEPKPRPVLLFSTQQLQDAQNSITQKKYGLIILFLFVHNFFLVRLFNTEHHLCHWFAIFGVNFCVLSEHFIIEGNAVRIWSWKLREKPLRKKSLKSPLCSFSAGHVACVFDVFHCLLRWVELIPTF